MSIKDIHHPDRNCISTDKEIFAVVPSDSLTREHINHIYNKRNKSRIKNIISGTASKPLRLQHLPVTYCEGMLVIDERNS